METLLELLPEIERLGEREAVLYDDGYRVQRWSGRELTQRIAGAAQALESRGLGAGDRILLWSENRPEWVAVFWGALARGVTVVPIDFRSSADVVRKVQEEVSARALVHGASVHVEDVDVEAIAIDEACPTSGERLEPVEADANDVVQVLYTSGTTGKPKGIVHRHRHLVANLDPIREEIRKYAPYARPFQPIRFLDLLPLSHVFGQFTGLFVTVALGGSVAFAKEMHPGAIVETIRRRRISVLVAVPRFLSHLRRHVERRYTLPEGEPLIAKGLLGGLARWWQHRKVHSAFGWKFWAILSGGARLDSDEEAFWYRLGFVLVQGYGLTETSSLVSTNHPFHPEPGSLGKAVGNQEIRLAEDGEILVRGDNVSREIYGAEATVEEGDDGEWLRTGDIGEIGPDGTLYYKGRKKDVIVGAEGMNVYPADVEGVLDDDPAVKEAVVVGRSSDEGEVVHAVLLLANRDADPSEIVQRANRQLEPHQRAREWTVWEEEDFPRTSSTFKVKRHEIETAVEKGSAARTEEPPGRSTTARSLLAHQLGRDPETIKASDALSEDLGLTSLDRIELMTRLEEHYSVALPEADMARIETVGELEEWLEEESTAPSAAPSRALSAAKEAAQAAPGDTTSAFSGLVRYARRQPLRLVRDVFRRFVMLPLFRRYFPLDVEGNLDEVSSPVIFAPNHTSNLDTVAILAALPRSWRRRLAPAISQNYFLPYLERTGTLGTRISLAMQYWLAVILVNVFPLPQSTRGVREALQFAGRLVDDGYSILIFPEGERTPDGRLHEFRPGVGLIAARLQAPVIPVHIEGLYELFPVGASWPKAGPVRVRFGAPLHFGEETDFREAAKRVEEAVKKLGGAPVSEESPQEGSEPPSQSTPASPSSARAGA